MNTTFYLVVFAKLEFNITGDRRSDQSQPLPLFPFGFDSLYGVTSFVANDNQSKLEPTKPAFTINESLTASLTARATTGTTSPTTAAHKGHVFV